MSDTPEAIALPTEDPVAGDFQITPQDLLMKIGDQAVQIDVLRNQLVRAQQMIRELMTAPAGEPTPISAAAAEATDVE